MAKSVALVTGAGGEMGHEIVPRLVEQGHAVVAVDLVALPESLTRLCVEAVEASILDSAAIEGLIARHAPRRVFHLAAVLSRKAEREPELAHRVNVEGTLDLFGCCEQAARRIGEPVQFMFPSSIAVYGLPDAAAKQRAGAVRENEWTVPAGIYGCTKLYCELVGSYRGRRAARDGEPGVDFRSIRFPGLISAETLPTGGTTDYASEMVHAAAQGRPYRCFVEPRTRLPFMTMPDGVDALLRLAAAPPDRLSTRVYNIRGFSPSASELREAVLHEFPDAEIGFEPHPARQAIVDTWPADVDDSAARTDWGLDPRHDLAGAVTGYLAPALRRRYAAPAGSKNKAGGGS